MAAKQTATFAYFPGTGPSGRRCSECAHLKAKTGKFAAGKEKFFCDKARIFINVAHETQAIPRDSPACKYFEEKAKEAAAA
jgi:hypothetical protein